MKFIIFTIITLIGNAAFAQQILPYQRNLPNQLGFQNQRPSIGIGRSGIVPGRSQNRPTFPNRQTFPNQQNNNGYNRNQQNQQNQNWNNQFGNNRNNQNIGGNQNRQGQNQSGYNNNGGLNNGSPIRVVIPWWYTGYIDPRINYVRSQRPNTNPTGGNFNQGGNRTNNGYNYNRNFNNNRQSYPAGQGNPVQIMR